MNRGSAKAVAIGLSTISLAGTVSFPVHAEASVDSESPLFAPSATNQQTPSEEVNIEETSEALQDTSNNIEEQVDGTTIPEAVEAKEAINDAAAATENIAKASEAMDEAQTSGDKATEDANDIADKANKIAEDINNKTENAIAVVNDTATSKEAAETIIANTKADLDKAKEDFNNAQTTYSQTLSDYEAALEDYNTAVAAYNNNKSQATSDLDKADASLTEATDKLEKMQAELEAARQSLVDAGASALITADENKADVTSYVETIVRYYYIPNTQLSEGQQVSDFNVVGTNQDYVTITYNVTDADGNVLRTVTADYGYETDESTGEIRIYDNQLFYEYTNADGEAVILTKEQADELEDGRVAIGTYFTATGFYIPRYQEIAKYEGSISKLNYSDAKAIKQGKDAVAADYADDRYFYNTEITFRSGTKTSWVFTYDLDIYYNVAYDQVETYYIIKANGGYNKIVRQLAASGKRVISTPEEFHYGIIRYIQEYQVDNPSQEYSSYEDALAAIKEQASDKYGAGDIDIANSSNLDIKENIRYATLAEKHINEDEPLFDSSKGTYTSYISSLKEKLSNYARLISEVDKAQNNYNEAKAKVNTLKSQIEKLDKANTGNSTATIAELEAKLDKANRNYEGAKAKLSAAENNLELAKIAYVDRFTTIDSSKPSDVVINPVINDLIDYVNAESINQKELEETEEPEELEEDANVIINDNVDNTGDNNSQGGNVADVDEQTDDTEEVTEEEDIVTIPDEETPKAITIAGILARGKWFIGLAGVSTAGVGVAVLEAKHRAAMKLLDKLNQ